MDNRRARPSFQHCRTPTNSKLAMATTVTTHAGTIFVSHGIIELGGVKSRTGGFCPVGSWMLGLGSGKGVVVEEVRRCVG